MVFNIYELIELQKMNLTAIKEVNEVMERHVEDSLAVIPPIRNSYLSHCSSSCDKLNLVDVGSGAGLPGVILAIACPGNSDFCNLHYCFGQVLLLFRKTYDVLCLYVFQG